MKGRPITIPKPFVPIPKHNFVREARYQAADNVENMYGEMLDGIGPIIPISLLGIAGISISKDKILKFIVPKKVA